jgi:chromosome segregation ATPase
MSPLVKTAILSVGALVVGLLIVLGVQRIVERQQVAERINALREELYRARVASDRCRSSLRNSEASLLALGQAIDSLRTRVNEFETMVQGGVPADRYEEYLDVFDQYNDSVAAWEGRERRLRSAETSCRATIEEHNELSDSLQTVLTEAGILAG